MSMKKTVDISKILFLSKASLLSLNSKIFLILESLCLDMVLYLIYLVKEDFPCTMMIEAVKEEVSCCINILNAITHWKYTVLKVVPEFVIT